MSSKRKRILPKWMKDPEASSFLPTEKEMGQSVSLSPTHSAVKAKGKATASASTKRHVVDNLSDDESDVQINGATNSHKDSDNRFFDSPVTEGVLNGPSTVDSGRTSSPEHNNGNSKLMGDGVAGHASPALPSKPGSPGFMKPDVGTSNATPIGAGSPGGALTKPNDGSSVSTSPVTSTARQTCFYGSSCYRKNPQHRVDFAHPGDSDYSDSARTSCNTGVSPTKDSRPLCDYGTACYRKNPQHCRDFRHDAPQKRKARPTELQDIPSDNDGDFDASFGSDDYDPSGSESDDSFVTLDSMDSGNSDYNPEDDDDDETKPRKKKKKLQQKNEGTKKKKTK